MSQTEGMSQEEIINFVITKIKKRKFSYLDEADIAQEAYLIIRSVLPQWDGIRPLENFLMLSVYNRLISLSRSYYRNPDRRNVLDFYELFDQPIQPKDTVCSADEVDYILDNLTPNLRSDFQRWANGVRISSLRKEAVVKAVREIMEDRDGEG